MDHGLYVHVPFCARKCPYCAFFSLPLPNDSIDAWLAGVDRELSSLPAGFRPSSVFFGGGTPTALPEPALSRLLDSVRSRVDISLLAEWSCEANPGTLSPAKARMLRQAGVNRLSVGAQSLRDASLNLLGRIHSADEVRACVALARDAGFSNLGLDLIYGLPGIPEDSFLSDVDAALELAPDHLSCYCLEIEDGTPFARRAGQGLLPVSGDSQRRLFDSLRARLADRGWLHYEISNFARPGRKCLHNLLYWTGGEYVGVGPSAHSHWNGVRYANDARLPSWSVAFRERLGPEAKARETLVMGLRRIAGWNRAEFFDATGFDYDALRGPEIARLAREGLLVVSPNRVRLADSALFVSDSVFAELV